VTYRATLANLRVNERPTAAQRAIFSQRTKKRESEGWIFVLDKETIAKAAVSRQFRKRTLIGSSRFIILVLSHKTMTMTPKCRVRDVARMRTKFGSGMRN